VKSKRYFFILPAGICLMWLVACASLSETDTAQDTKRTTGADGASLLVASPGQKQMMTLKDFRVGTGQNRILVLGVHAEEKGKQNVEDMKISRVMLGDRELTLLAGSEVQFSSMWQGDEFFLKVALYYFINPPSGTHDITVAFAGPVTSGNVGGICLYNARQAAPVILSINKQSNQKKIISEITTKNDGAWVVDIVGCGHKSKLRPKLRAHRRRFNAQETNGGKSSLLGGTLPVPEAGKVTLQWGQFKRSINRLAHVAVEIAPYN
jgi:hypothetical protein